jgi:hypothetical protein
MIPNSKKLLNFTIFILLLNYPQAIFPHKLTKIEIEKIRHISDILSEKQIKYGKQFFQNGKKGSIKMDCSNTVKYLYRESLGITLPRTSFEQYQTVKNAGKFQSTPKTAEGKIDTSLLRKKLKIGDLMFWINTHNDIPKEWDPPIGHVMVFMGRSKTGKLTMFGAGTFGKGKRTQSGGVDFYHFDPEDSLGCIKDNIKNCIKESEFIGFGKPSLE